MENLLNTKEYINLMLERYGVRFGIYKNGLFKEQLFPFDSIPRIISKNEFDKIEKGLIQRVKALNCFLNDIYSQKQIIKDGIVAEEFVFSSSGYLPICENVKPIKNIYSHISGIDLVEGKDGEWYILEDNLRIPSGASYPLIARDICRHVSPETFVNNHVEENRNYADLLKEVMDTCNCGGINVILTPGRYNAAFFEHSYLAERTHSILALPEDLFVENDHVFYRDYSGHPKKVGSIYRRISDEYLDPMAFNSESLIGVPYLFDAYKKGNVAIINAPGNGIADDKGIYYFVPKMIRYYLNEEPILKNAPTYLPFYPEDQSYVLNNIQNLVIKDVAEAGGYGVIFGSELDEDGIINMKKLITTESRRFIAQEVIDFKDLNIEENGKKVPRKADLRAFVLYGKEVKVWKCGLTRFSRNPDSFVVNSSQGGGFKDTWVLSQ